MISKVVVTGGSGFLGNYVVRELVASGYDVIVVDRGTYAAKVKGLLPVLSKIKFLTGDLREQTVTDSIMQENPDAIIHMAAETHVDRSIDDPMCFVDSNIRGTVQLLQSIVKKKANSLDEWPKLIVYSTDEVYGPTPEGEQFKEDQSYNPSNAYSASKVAIEAYCNAFRTTHKMPIIIVRPCNTYAPGQYPEKLIPLFVKRMLAGKAVPLFGKGEDRRDWLYGTDHAAAVIALLEKGIPGESYNMAADDEHTNYNVTTMIYKTLLHNGHLGDKTLNNMSMYINYVEARPGHDRRYWMDGSKLRALGWKPEVSFESGIETTILWYAEHPEYHDSDLYAYPNT